MIDSRMIDAARIGDRDARAELLRNLQDRWFRFCLSFLRDAELARDATQETALRFLQQLPAFRGQSQLSTWSLGIALNVAREMRRRSQRMKLSDTLEAETGKVAQEPPDPVVFAESKAMLREQISSLPDRQKEAVLLRFFEELSTSETAAAMECSEGTVKATVHQALRTLRKKLKQLI